MPVVLINFTAKRFRKYLTVYHKIFQAYETIAAEIANLLQLEDFPLTMSKPAAIDLEFVKQEGAMQRQPPEPIPPPLQ